MNEPYAVTGWNELFAQHERFVFRLAYDLVHDRHLAEDLVQQTWLTAIERPPTARRSLKGWLATVLRNLAIDHFRTDRRPKAQADDQLAHGERESYADEEEAAAIRQSVLDSLHELDPIYRDVLHLHYIEGRTLAAVAEELSLPLETARTRCRRGLSRLRGRLDRQYRGRRPWVAALAPFALRAPEAWLAPGAPDATPGATPGATPDATPGAATGAARRAPRGSTATAPATTLAARWLPAAAVLVPSIALIAFVGLALTRAERGPELAAVEAGSDADPLRGSSRLIGSDGASSRVALQAPGTAAAAAAPEPDVARVRVLHAETGEPLAGVRVLLQTESAEVHAHSPVLVSDDEGWVALEGIGPGRWTVRPERGPAMLIDLPWGGRDELVVRVPDGLEVAGRVLGPDGVPVPFASVHVTWPGWIRAQEVATSDAHGLYRVPRMDRTSMIAAGDDLGYGWLISFDNPEHAGLTTIEADLYLPGPGRVIEGTVVDEAGRPLAGVSVRGLARLRTTALPPDAELVGDLGTMAPPGEIVTTDAAGRFRIGHFRADVDEVPISAWADGFARASATAVDGPVVIRMEREAVVEGEVRSRDGAPVAWARVSARVPGHPQPTIARADADGRFRVTRLPAGRITLEALSDRSGAEGWVSGEVELQGGATTRWDPVLGEVARIRGRAIDDAGRPLAGWVVQIVVEAEIESHRATGRFNDNRLIRGTVTDDDGAFAFYGCRPAKHLVKAYAPDETTGFPRAWQWSVSPDQPAIVLRADGSTAARSRVRGRLVSASGDPSDSAQVRLYSRLIGRTTTVEVAPGSGDFDIGPLPAADYQISIWVPPAGFQPGPSIELGPGEVVDLGQISYEPAAASAPQTRSRR